MNKLFAVGLVTALTCTSVMAQTTASPGPGSTKSVTGESLQQRVANDMQNAGFTDVHVRPDSFLVQAKDKNGMPITMLIDPNSVTEIVGVNGAPNGQTAASTGGAFTTVPAADMLGTKVIGTNVQNDAKQDIGSIKDVAYSDSGVKAYIVGVGGFLGMGDHYVAVSPSALHLSYDTGSKSWHATMNATADQLKAAPEFKYPS